MIIKKTTIIEEYDTCGNMVKKTTETIEKSLEDNHKEEPKTPIVVPVNPWEDMPDKGRDWTKITCCSR